MNVDQPKFYEPKPIWALVQLAQWISPLVGRFHYKMSLQVETTGLELLKSLRNKRVLLLPNHPTFHDPVALFLLSAQLHDFFYFLAAYEQFQTKVGYWLPKLGCYSIRRGLLDRTSIAQTLDLLARPTTKLVIFAEGGCSFQNDTVMPFRPGAIQMAFQAMNRLVKQGEKIPDLYAVPISLKYRYIDDMTNVIQDTVTRLEQALNVPISASHNNNYDRLRVIAEQILLHFEETYKIATQSQEKLSWNERILSLKTHVIEQCEQALGIMPNSSLPIRERVYKVQDLVSSRDSDSSNPYWNNQTIEKAIFRLLNFDAIQDGYVAENPTPERFLDTLTRLEREVFGIDQPPPKGQRKVLIRISEAVNLADYFESYSQSKSHTVEYLTQTIQNTVQTNINLLDQDR